MLQRSLQGERERIHVGRLGDEVVRANPDCGDRRLDAAERGEHRDRHVRVVGDDPLAQLEAVHAGHVHVGHDGIDLGRPDRLERGVGRRSPRDLEAAVRQIGREQPAHVAIVVDDEHTAVHAAVSLGVAVAARGGRALRQRSAKTRTCSRRSSSDCRALALTSRFAAASIREGNP